MSGICLYIRAYYFASLRIASMVLASSVRVVSISAMIVSTRILSYHIDTSDDMSVISLVFWVLFSGVVDFFEKSIDPLRSTMIFCAVFLPIHGTLDRSLSSSICMACISVSLPSPRSDRAVLPPMPFTLLRLRNRWRSSIDINQNKSSLTSVLWWWIQRDIFFSWERFPRTEGDTSISKPSPVPCTCTVKVIPSIARMSHSIYQNIGCIIEKKHKITSIMEKTNNIIDIFVDIVDNYGDMGFAIEFIQACRVEYGEQFNYNLWTNNVSKMYEFARLAGIADIDIVDIVDFWYLRKSAIWISLLHAPIPDLNFFAEKALILRIDYISLDPTWIENNEWEYIWSTPDRQIIELIPSPLQDSAGLIPAIIQQPISQIDKHIVIFAYSDCLNHIDWKSFPDDINIFVFGKIDSDRQNIISLDFLPSHEFYSLLDSSEFVIIRGEVSFAHMIQTRLPFFWNIYSGIGGFPREQSEQYLAMIDASPEYCDIHSILNSQKSGKISYSDCVWVLSHTWFSSARTHNLIHTVKKHIDRFNNSI